MLLDPSIPMHVFTVQCAHQGHTAAALLSACLLSSVEAACSEVPLVQTLQLQRQPCTDQAGVKDTQGA